MSIVIRFIHKSKLVALFALLWVCLASAGVLNNQLIYAQAQTNSTISILGHFGGEISTVFIDGTIAYIGQGPALVILDVSNPTDPILIGKTSPLPSSIHDIVVVDKLAYVANGQNGFVIIDVSSSTRPVLVGSLDIPGWSISVQVTSDVAYIGTDGMFMSIDISNPSLPTIINSIYSSDGIYDIKISENVAYVANASRGLTTIDIADATNLKLLSNYYYNSRTNHLDIIGNTAYMADSYGLTAINVSNPANPVISQPSGTYDLTGVAYDLQIFGNTAYVGTPDRGLIILDISNKSAPVKLGSLDTNGEPRKIELIGNILYVADYYGFAIVDVGDPTTPNLLSYYHTIDARNLYVNGNTAYIADRHNGFVTADIHNPNLLDLIGSYKTPGDIYNIQVVENTAYVADLYKGFTTIDVSNPTMPILLDSYDENGGNVFSSDVHDNIAYVANDLNGLMIIDVSNPSAISKLGSFNIDGGVNDVQVVGNIAYVAVSSKGLVIIDVSNPATPNLLGSYNTVNLVPPITFPDTFYTYDGEARSIYVKGNTAYIANGPSGLKIIDVSNPTTPKLLGTYDTQGSAREVYVSGNIAYIADYDELVIVDISNPVNPKLLHSYKTAGGAHGVYVVNGIIYVASYNGGLYIFEHILPPQSGDVFELDNECGNSSNFATTDGIVQEHTFHDFGDVDWVKFEAVAGEIYQIEADIPPGSLLNLVAELYPRCDTSWEVEFSRDFSPQVSMEYEASTTGTQYLKLYNHTSSVFGHDKTYELSITKIEPTPAFGSVIIVAGREFIGDRLQDNIYNATLEFFKLFSDSGYPASRIHFIAPKIDLARPAYLPAGDVLVDKLATKANLEDLITNVVYNQVDAEHPLTLYMISHSTKGGGFYLDGVNGEIVTPAELDSWLDQLQANRPNLQINIIIDSCYSGQFISATRPISGPNRIVIASSSDSEKALADDYSARFSGYFFTGIRGGSNLRNAFTRASAAVSSVTPAQHPWIDANGNGQHNEIEDNDIAITRHVGIRYSGSFGQNFPPYIMPANTTVTVADGIATVRSQILDNAQVDRAYAIFYPPSYQVVAGDDGRIQPIDPLLRVDLTPIGNDLYEATYQLSELGEYEVAVYAVDNEETLAVPVAKSIVNDTVYQGTPLSVQERVSSTQADSPKQIILLVAFVMMSLFTLWHWQPLKE